MRGDIERLDNEGFDKKEHERHRDRQRFRGLRDAFDYPCWGAYAAPNLMPSSTNTVIITVGRLKLASRSISPVLP